uniref:Uncharacterized protein n=1 Tax=Oryzias latipes TaxID=8090 RepID=A0A3B3H857_ORYLA
MIQFKVLHRLHYSKTKLNKIFPAVSAICDRCKTSELGHLFWFCPLLYSFLSKIFTCISDSFDKYIQPNSHLISFWVSGQDDQTPLHISSRLGKQDIVQLLLTNGADPDATTNSGYTPLHLAAREGHKDIAAALLDQGANLSGITPLHLAAQEGSVDIVTLLLARGSPINRPLCHLVGNHCCVVADNTAENVECGHLVSGKCLGREKKFFKGGRGAAEEKVEEGGGTTALWELECLHSSPLVLSALAPVSSLDLLQLTSPASPLFNIYR